MARKPRWAGLTRNVELRSQTATPLLGARPALSPGYRMNGPPPANAVLFADAQDLRFRSSEQDGARQHSRFARALGARRDGTDLRGRGTRSPQPRPRFAIVPRGQS